MSATQKLERISRAAAGASVFSEEVETLQAKLAANEITQAEFDTEAQPLLVALQKFLSIINALAAE